MTLLVLKINQLGDNVVFLPVVQALMAQHPEWEMVVMTSHGAARLYEVCCPGVKLLRCETHAFNRAWRRPATLLRLAAEVRAVRPDACLLGDDQGSVAHLLAWLSGAKRRVGPATPHVRLNRLLGTRVEVINEEPVAEHNWRITQTLTTLPGPMAAPDLRAFGTDASGAIVMHAGASREYQRWPLRRYAELANELSKTHAVRWISQAGDEACGLVDAVQRVKTNTLDELVRTIAGARVYVGNNSGPMHIACACGVRSVILVGPSSMRWDPAWNQDKFDLLREPKLSCQPCDLAMKPVDRCLNVEAPMACLNRWSVETVYARVLQAWETEATSFKQPTAGR